MTPEEIAVKLTETEACSKSNTHRLDAVEALQVLWDNINRGQQIQLYKVPEIRSLLERYGVEVEA